jgi:hypothetical protein
LVPHIEKFEAALMRSRPFTPIEGLWFAGN